MVLQGHSPVATRRNVGQAFSRGVELLDYVTVNLGNLPISGEDVAE